MAAIRSRVVRRAGGAGTNTSVIDGRRLSTGAGFLDRLPDILPGNVVCRAIDEDSARADPTRDAWRRQTHSLFWEPA